jgi:hypothetical protein
MSPEFRRNLGLLSQGVIAVCLLVIVTIRYVVPFLADRYYADEFRRLAADCDLAMHDEAAVRDGRTGAEKAQLLTLSADVALAVCHDYDKLRKRLLVLGVSEDLLALRSLEALEVERIPVQRLVEPHKMERF